MTKVEYTNVLETTEGNAPSHKWLSIEKVTIARLKKLLYRAVANTEHNYRVADLQITYLALQKPTPLRRKKLQALRAKVSKLQTKLNELQFDIGQLV